jgi:Fe-S cluster biogenesis protein NfuA
MRDKIEKILNEKIRPTLISDGGNIELVNVDETQGIVTVKLTGACAGCPMAQMTSVGFVEKILKENIPEIKTVKISE